MLKPSKIFSPTSNQAHMNSVKVKYQSEIYEFESLDQAMVFAKKLGEFVRIEYNGMEVVGKFGVDGMANGKLSSGEPYTWKKRRKH